MGRSFSMYPLQEGVPVAAHPGAWIDNIATAPYLVYERGANLPVAIALLPFRPRCFRVPLTRLQSPAWF